MAQHNRPSLTLSEACQILSSQYRRQILWYLTRTDSGFVELDELVGHILEEIDEATTTNRVRLLLIHTHIPKLADHGVIEYDRRNKDIRYRDGTILEDLLEVVSVNSQSA
jgi:hypothetical protein